MAGAVNPILILARALLPDPENNWRCRPAVGAPLALPPKRACPDAPAPFPPPQPPDPREADPPLRLFVFVAALPLAVAGLLITREARRTLEARIASENAALAGAVGTLVEERAEQAIRSLQDAALSPDLREALEARDTQRLEARLKRVRETFALFNG